MSKQAGQISFVTKITYVLHRADAEAFKVVIARLAQDTMLRSG